MIIDQTHPYLPHCSTNLSKYSKSYSKKLGSTFLVSNFVREKQNKAKTKSIDPRPLKTSRIE